MMSGPDETTIKQIGPIWRELWGGVWHATHPERFLSILDDSAILHAPPHSDHNNTFAQTLGGVSLFDFQGFEPLKYEVSHPPAASAWRSFTPCRREWAGAVWLEVDCEKTGAAFVSSAELFERWNIEKPPSNILPRLEAAHIGDLPLDNLRTAIFIRDRDNGKFHKFDCTAFNRMEYEALLPEWRKDFEFASLPYFEQLKKRPQVNTNAPPDLWKRLEAARRRVKKN